MACIPLKKVCPDHSRWKVKVRAVRFCEKFTNDQPPKTLRFEFIMLDEKNVAMEAAVPAKWIDLHRPNLKEGGVFTIHYFEVCNARAMYRPVDHPYMARFTKYTKISEVGMVPPNFPMFACSITPFPILRDRVGNKEQMSDVIGLFTKCSHILKQSTRNGIQSLVNVHLTNGRDNAVLALWGSQAEKFDAQPLMEMGKNIPVVLLFVGVTSNIFDGRLTLQCSATSTWYVNPALPETTIMQQSFGPAVGGPYWVGENHDGQPQSVTVTELSAIDNPHEAEGNTYKVVARIKELVPNEQWSYLACTKCKRSTRPYGDSYKCYDPMCVGTDAVPRYKIAFLATDPEANSPDEERTIEIICFGAVADEMVGLPADSLVALSSNVQGYIPEQVKRLFDAKFEFKLSVPKGAVRRGRTSFKVDSFSRISEVQELQVPELMPLPASEPILEGKKIDDVPISSDQSDQPHNSTPIKGILPSSAPGMIPTILEEKMITDAPISSNESGQSHKSTPAKDLLGSPPPDMIPTPPVTKEKHAIGDTNTEEYLDDSDCETDMPSKKKPRAARKLSMVAEEDDE